MKVEELFMKIGEILNEEVLIEPERGKPYLVKRDEMTTEELQLVADNFQMTADSFSKAARSLRAILKQRKAIH